MCHGKGFFMVSMETKYVYGSMYVCMQVCMKLNIWKVRQHILGPNPLLPNHQLFSSISQIWEKVKGGTKGHHWSEGSLSLIGRKKVSSGITLQVAI